MDFIDKIPKNSSTPSEQHIVNSDTDTAQIQGVAVISENYEAKEKVLVSIGEILFSNQE